MKSYFNLQPKNLVFHGNREVGLGMQGVQMHWLYLGIWNLICGHSVLNGLPSVGYFRLSNWIFETRFQLPGKPDIKGS